MEFKTDEANLRADSNQAGEIDLYDELVAFSSLSPEDQSCVPAPRPVNDSEEAICEPVKGRENQSVEPIKQQPFDLIDRAELRPVEEPSANAIEDFPFELPYEPAPEMERKPSFESPRAGQSNPGQPNQGTGDLDLAYLLRVTGPLIALGLTMNSDSSLLVCRDCRSQSSSKDMFCVNCGGLLEGTEVADADTDDRKISDVAAEAATVKSVCADCNYLIEADEVFCPSCGAVI
jgi:RNA polymerase subunit RPABC4/transcription elongation factor Spt4